MKQPCSKPSTAAFTCKLSLQAITRWCSLPLLPAFSLANRLLSALLLGEEPGIRADTNTRAHRHCWAGLLPAG